MKRRLLTLLFLCASIGVVHAQNYPVYGLPFTVLYNADQKGVFTAPEHLELVYVFNYWNSRQGTRLALWENVMKPDTARVRRLPLKKTSMGWTAEVPLDSNSAVFSYYVTDGVKRDDNGRKTYTAYVMNKDGQPVRNARFFMTSFLELAQADIAEQTKEAEGEILFYPLNIRAYPKFFSLLMARDKGNDQAQKRIVEILDNLEKQYPQSPDVLSLCARTYYYIFRDTKRGLAYKERIDAREQWPEVAMMLDRDQLLEDNRRLALENETRRKNLLNTPMPEYEFTAPEGAKYAVTRDRGKVAVLMFFVTSSEQSRRLLATMKDVPARFGATAAHFVAITLDQAPEAARGYFTRSDLPFDLFVNNAETIEKLGIDGLPYTVVIDQRGIIRNIFLGMTPTLVDEIQRAVGALERN